MAAVTRDLIEKATESGRASPQYREKRVCAAQSSNSAKVEPHTCIKVVDVREGANVAHEYALS